MSLPCRACGCLESCTITASPPAPSPISLQTNPDRVKQPCASALASASTADASTMGARCLGSLWGMLSWAQRGRRQHRTTALPCLHQRWWGKCFLGALGQPRALPMPTSSTRFGGRGGEAATRSPHGGDNPQLPRRRFPFFTQWPLAVRADLRALVKSADSSLAGSQRHLGLAENTSLQGPGENRQPDERSTHPEGVLGRADPRHRPSQGWLHASFSAGFAQRGWRHGAGCTRETRRATETPTRGVESR